MIEVRRILRIKAHEAEGRPDGFVHVRPLDMLALLDDLDTLERLRELVFDGPQRLLRCKHVDTASHYRAHALVTLRSVPPARAEEHSQTRLCAICAGLVAHLLTELEQA